MAPVKGNGRRTMAPSAAPAASVECFFTNSQTRYRKLAYSETRIWKLPLWSTTPGAFGPDSFSLQFAA